MGNNLNNISELIKPDGGNLCVTAVSDAYDFCRRLAQSHYENFPVASILIPKSARKHIFAVYAFARTADDIADELDIFPDNKVALLNQFYSLLELPPAGNPVILALSATISEKQLPLSLFRRLIDAFVSDSCFRIPQKWDDISSYCHNSADPVGELVLRICNEATPETIALSDSICTALQLVNFWQDLSRDFSKGRQYIPVSVLQKYSIDFATLFSADCNTNVSAVLKDIIAHTKSYFDHGRPLVALLKSPKLRAEIALTIAGGEYILAKVEELGPKILNTRPIIQKIHIFALIIKTFVKNRLFIKWIA